MVDEQLSIFGSPDVFDPATWPAVVGPKDGSLYRKKFLTRAWRVQGEFAVETSEGRVSCQDGYLAQDSRGYYYPIAKDEFDAIYESVMILEPDESAISDQTRLKEKVVSSLSDFNQNLTIWGTDKGTDQRIVLAIITIRETLRMVELVINALETEDRTGIVCLSENQDLH